MKLLFDQNISHRIVSKISSFFPDCIQVRLSNLENSSDIEIWNYAKSNDYSIVTFDADFYDFVILKGHPPKVIWLRIGNTSTNNLEKILMEKKDIIQEFITSEKHKDIGCLEIKENKA